MQIPIDFSHRITIENLDTGTRQVFLMPRGGRTPVPVPDSTVSELNDLVPGVPDDTVTVPPASVLGQAPQPRLSPGTVGDRITPKDAFGAAEG